MRFSLVREVWKGQKVVREGPSRVVWRFIFENEEKDGFSSFLFSESPIDNDNVSAIFEPCPDPKALTRGKEGEDKSYLKPDEKGYWNPTKDTAAFVRQIDYGKVLFFPPKSSSFMKFLTSGKLLSGFFTLSREGETDMWKWKKVAGPGKRIKFYESDIEFEDKKSLSPEGFKLLGERLRVEENAELQKKLSEGGKAFQYPDRDGWAIGYGSQISKDQYPEGLDEAEVEALFFKDVSSHVSDAISLPLFFKLNESRRIVICDMVYSLGKKGVLDFKKMWEAIEKEDWEVARKELLDSDYHRRDVGVRAINLADILLSGIYKAYE